MLGAEGEGELAPAVVWSGCIPVGQGEDIQPGGVEVCVSVCVCVCVCVCVSEGVRGVQCHVLYTCTLYGSI